MVLLCFGLSLEIVCMGVEWRCVSREDFVMWPFFVEALLSILG